MTGIDKAMMRTLPNGATVRQICLVVRDIERAMEQWNALGIGPWQLHDFGPPWVRELRFRGKLLRTPVKLALANSGTLSFELIQPGDEMNVYTEHINAHGEGLHHLGYLVENIQTAIDEMSALGYGVAQSGRHFGVDGDGAFAYFDTVDALGCMLEAIQPPRQLPDPVRWYPAPPE